MHRFHCKVRKDFRHRFLTAENAKNAEKTLSTKIFLATGCTDFTEKPRFFTAENAKNAEKTLSTKKFLATDPPVRQRRIKGGQVSQINTDYKKRIPNTEKT